MCVILCLLAAGVGIVYLKVTDLPVEIKYKLLELSEDQAVLVVYSYVEQEYPLPYCYY